jgi:antitoxin VapB
MATARVFKSGNSQAVRLPKKFRFRSKEVEIFRRGDEIVLKEKAHGLARAFDIIANLDLDVEAIERLKKELPEEIDFQSGRVPRRQKRA